MLPSQLLLPHLLLRPWLAHPFPPLLLICYYLNAPIRELVSWHLYSWVVINSFLSPFFWSSIFQWILRSRFHPPKFGLHGGVQQYEQHWRSCWTGHSPLLWADIHQPGSLNVNGLNVCHFAQGLVARQIVQIVSIDLRTQTMEPVVNSDAS